MLEISSLPEKQIRDVIEGKKHLWEAKAQVNKKRQQKDFENASKITLGKNIKLYCGDCLELANKYLKDDSIDCIITDPPYLTKQIDCFEKLGQIAQRVLKPSGFCCFYTGKLNLAEIINIASQYLDYYWQIIIQHYGSCGTNFNPKTIHAKKVNTFYKPILVFQKPPAKKCQKYFNDVINGSGIQKDLHPWQQSESELVPIVEAFTQVGDEIFDPFLGSGTTAIVSKNLKRKFVGFDVDENCLAATKRRLTEDLN
ncbi:Modification methylase DpnIIB [Limihaloglobus sulfuriphilus]|uniref:Methyltransferase n=1 Tax=Limihaloglobus sulfuriphilus TaxID=1851148 RepID=A0A1Q2MDG5_9BACT|nr:site-specific DNA-methyltransferase [Limihaloglobus sulfuriphilus]AQQ70746.1 Modification methylase DpnIIB [Limihaloglobus sulfuriphilus]